MCLQSLNETSAAACIYGSDNVTRINTSSGQNGDSTNVLASSVLLLGVLPNILVMICVIADHEMHKPTFVMIAGLALSDLIALITSEALILHKYVINKDDWAVLNMDMTSYVLMSMASDSSVTSCLHIIALACMRYMIVVHTFKARVWLTVRKTVLISFLLWIAGSLVQGVFIMAPNIWASFY